jgi:DNA-binding NarL/FixJ family response regulator
MSRDIESGMEQMRVVLIGMPRMLTEIVREVIRAEPDLTIVGDFSHLEAARATIDARRPAVVITVLEQTVQADGVYLLDTNRQMRVLSVSADGDETLLCELRPHEQNLGELSVQEFLRAIRGTL